MKKNNLIAYQGSIGSYSEELLSLLYPEKNFLPCETFSDLIENVKSKEILGLLPVENSIAGTVIEAYEELIDSNLKIYSEHIKKIDHSLIGLSNSRLEEITRVISHPQALQQCSKFIQNHNLKISPVFDTAGSVLEILNNNDKNLAAIAGNHFKSDNRLKILKKNISNHLENFTRFFLVGKENFKINESSNKISSVLISDDKPGSLLKALNIFDYYQINLTKLESRPILGRPWEYKFYIDYQLINLEVQEKLTSEIKNTSKEFKILGHYPSARK